MADLEQGVEGVATAREGLLLTVILDQVRSLRWYQLAAINNYQLLTINNKEDTAG